MKHTKVCTVKRAVSALAARTTVAACSAATQSSLGPSEIAQNGSHRVGPLATVSNVVQIDNQWSQTMLGSGSAPSRSISHTPLPAVAPKRFESVSHVHVQHDLRRYCAFVHQLRTSSNLSSKCAFSVAYNGTNFMYSVTQGMHTDSAAKPSPISNIDELLTYDQTTPSLRHR